MPLRYHCNKCEEAIKMGHYASEMGLFDPSEETIKFNARIDRMCKLLETIGLTRFSGSGRLSHFHGDESTT